MSIKMKSIILLVILSFSLEAESLPSEWRFATEAELSDEERNDSKTKYTKIEADFNGDGIKDKALLVKSTKFSGQGLIVKLSNKEHYSWIVLDTIHWGKEYKDVSLAMGISLVKAQRIQTACGKGYWECKDNEKPFVSFQHASIDYFKFGSTNSVFYWSDQEKKFKRVWQSD